ncbi:MAG TPA: hypothetical protein VML00_00560 [Bacteroidota bacterium]|nr:hypothetical protein [Bacteroidota bacterium]
MADIRTGWMTFRIGCSLFGRMVWNLLCFDFTMARIYAFIFYVHCFTDGVVERVEEEEDNVPVEFFEEGKEAVEVPGEVDESEAEV